MSRIGHRTPVNSSKPDWMEESFNGYDEEANKIVREGIANLLIAQPFYGSILLRLRLEQQAIGTFGTNGRVLIYDPRFAKSLTHKQLRGVLAHEAGHVAGLHPLRKGYRDNHKCWNVSCDHEVNEIVLNRSGFELPEGTIPPRQGLAEEFYEEYQKRKKGSEEDEGDLPEGWCEVGGIELEPGETFEEVEREIKDIVREAITISQEAGKVPEGMERIIEEYFSSKLNWDEILRQFISTHKEPYTSWNTPKRRHLARGFILPGRGKRPTISEIAIAVDASGSMHGDILTQAVSETRYVIEEFYSAETEIPVIWFDHGTELEWFRPNDPELEVITPKGGGGTSFRLAIEAHKKYGLTQPGLVIITDGICHDFGEEPEHCEVLWVVFKGYEFDPPFGKVVYLEMGN